MPLRDARAFEPVNPHSKIRYPARSFSLQFEHVVIKLKRSTMIWITIEYFVTIRTFRREGEMPFCDGRRHAFTLTDPYPGYR